MNHLDIPSLRLINQHLIKPDFKTPEEVVKYFGAMQAQDYLGSLWAIGQRMHNGTDQLVDQAITDRTIVRSWPMRGTLHFTAAEDLRWMLRLCTPRIFKRLVFRHKELELTKEIFHKSEKLIVNALMGGKQLTREEIFALFKKNTIAPGGQRGIHILLKLAMEGLICFGARSGKQFTFTLLDEWIPESKSYDHDEALGELVKRYFTSHGPATIRDFVWWSGLTVADTKKGLDMMKTHLAHETIDGQSYWFAEGKKELNKTQKALFLSAYDEYTVAYKNRSAIIDEAHFIQAGNGLRPTIVLNGRIVGTWKRVLKKHAFKITPHLFHMLDKSEQVALHNATVRYGAFLGKTGELH